MQLGGRNRTEPTATSHKAVPRSKALMVTTIAHSARSHPNGLINADSGKVINLVSFFKIYGHCYKFHISRIFKYNPL